MPFVQRVVQPIYVSRAKKTRQPIPPPPPTIYTGTAAADAVDLSAAVVRWHTPGSFCEATQTSAMLPPPPPSPTPSPPAQHRKLPASQSSPGHHSDISRALEEEAATPSTPTSATTSVVTARTAHSHYAQHQQQQQQQITDSDGCEFEAVTNRTLSNALRQLASLMLIANDIFTELHAELQTVGGRTMGMRGRIERLVCRVDAFDPKLVTVPESDLATFVQIKNHFRSAQPIQTGLFTATTRPDNVRQLYDAAAKTPVEAIDEMARLSGRADAHRRGSDVFLCTPVLGQNRRRMRTNVDVEIETRMPAAIDDLRRWTSSEAIGDITVTPDCVARVVGTQNTSATTQMHHMQHTHSLALASIHEPSSATATGVNDSGDNDMTDAVNLAAAAAAAAAAEAVEDMPLDHRLPSPEEQCQIIALRFPAEVIRVDTSARRFERMCSTRKSMLNVPVSSSSRRSRADAAGAGAGNAEAIAAAEENGDEIQLHPVQPGATTTTGGASVKRRSRSRKPRNKRRNTIAGTDQREIEEAAKCEGDAEDAALAAASPTTNDDETTAYATLSGHYGGTSAATTTTAVPRSKSSDLLRRDASLSTATSADSANANKSHRLSHFNTLKQWGRNRLRLAMQRNSTGETTGASTSASTATISANSATGSSPPSAPLPQRVSDADDDCNVYETCISKHKRKYLEKERRLSHERKPSYSSSEKSIAGTVASSTASTASSMAPSSTASTVPIGVNAVLHPMQPVLHLHNLGAASINPVKLRESSALRRQRRCGLGHKDELNSSSGNWSASSESGRTSIGSELTVPPKSSASSTSLNHSHMSGHSSQPGGYGGGCGSGPPSSIISRRRFLNTSASSSVTSDGTVTPDLGQHMDGAGNGGGAGAAYHDDDGASSAYSCDTEGYYTSFHVDSGLKTLKEEDTPMTPLHTSSALSSTQSFGSTSNKTVLSASADEYELFGRGSTSTTASSAGTVCTQLHGTPMMGSGSGSAMGVISPSVPERKSSLTKLNRSNSTTSTTSTLERSCSSSTVGSTLERTGTIKRNGVLLQKKSAEMKAAAAAQAQAQSAKRLESPDSGNLTSSPPAEQQQQQSVSASASDVDQQQSESSDFEGVERAERIRSKTAINSSRIPSLCVITPSNSDDDGDVANVVAQQLQAIRARHASPPRAAQPVESEYAEVVDVAVAQKPLVVGTELKRDYFKRSTLLPLNSMLGRLKGVLPALHKRQTAKPAPTDSGDFDEPLYDQTGGGEYVTIADVTNNNQMKRQTSGGFYYSNDLLKQNLAAVLAAPTVNEETEYVSLNELPLHPNAGRAQLFGGQSPTGGAAQSRREEQKIDSKEQQAKVGGCDDGVVARASSSASSSIANAAAATPERGAQRVTLDANGKVVYNSDSLRRRKGAHTTFAPGPCVKDEADAEEQYAEIAAASQSSVPSRQGDLAASTSSSSGVIVLNQQQIAAVLSTPKRQQPASVRPVIQQSLLRPVKHHVEDISGSSIPNKPSVSSAAADDDSAGEMMRQQQSPSQPGYPHSSRDDADVVDAPAYTRPTFGSGSTMSASSSSSTLPRRPTAASMTLSQTPSPTTTIQPPQPHIPFQRANNAYWTLQLRKSQSPPKQLQADAAKPQLPANIEELYSTPHKNRTLPRPLPAIPRPKEQLRPTAHGFGNYFSPIGKAAAAADPSPIDPRANQLGFRTSTPTKLAEGPQTTPVSSLTDELRQRLHLQHKLLASAAQQHEGSYHPHSSTPSLFGAAGSPLSSGRSTPRPQLEPQHTTGGSSDQLASTSCSDRMGGASKTTLMDFKKLLLAKAAGKMAAPASKPSAVEQLRLAKAAAALAEAGGATSKAAAIAAAVTSAAPAASCAPSAMNILDLSGSPKTFANRRMIRQGQFGGGSPSKVGHQLLAEAAAASENQPLSKLHMSPRSAWKFAHLAAPYRTDVMSTAIPEAHSEEDTSNGSQASQASSAVTTIDRSEGNASLAEPAGPDSPDASEEGASSASSTSSSSSSSSSSAGAILTADTINLKTNIFLQAEENNFMRGEMATKSLSRAQMAQARNRFLAGAGGHQQQQPPHGGGQSAPGSPLMQQQQQHHLAQFKNGHYTGLSPTRTLPRASAAATATMFRAQTEQILDTSGEGAPTPSLETAL